jgi:hypothetical protein
MLRNSSNGAGRPEAAGSEELPCHPTLSWLIPNHRFPALAIPTDPSGRSTCATNRRTAMACGFAQTRHSKIAWSCRGLGPARTPGRLKKQARYREPGLWAKLRAMHRQHGALGAEGRLPQGRLLITTNFNKLIPAQHSDPDQDQNADPGPSPRSARNSSVSIS